MARRPALLPLVFLLPLFAAACATEPANPSFPLTVDEAEDAIKQMQARPRPLARPLVVVGGYLGVGFGPRLIRERVRAVTGDDRIATVALFTCWDMDDCREKIVAAVDAAFPSDDPDRTAEVDVVGISIGGVAAQYAAAPARGAEGAVHPRRLRIARLFTISSPHRGAALAALPTFQPLVRQVRPGSAFLAALDAAGDEADYPIYPYVRLGDECVGAANASPPGRAPWWVPDRPFEGAHAGAPGDPRILADIARRLRGEEPFTRGPPAAIPP